MNRTERIAKGEDATASELEIIATAAGAASKSGGAGQVAPVELGLEVAQSVAVPAPGVAELSSEEIANQFLLAMAGLTDGADEGAAGLIRTLTASLQENKANVQNTLQPILIAGSPVVTDVSNALPPALSQDTVDLGAWLKKLALALSEEPSRDVSGEAALQPLQTEPLKSASDGKDADGPDLRLLVSAAQNQDSVAPKASPVSPANAPESMTPAALDKLVLQSVRYLVSSGEKSVTIQLSPPSLGELRIEVSSVKNTLNVSLLSGNPGVRDVLESHALGLREALARSGIEVTHVAVLPALAGHAADQQYAGQAQPDFTRMTPAVRSGVMPQAESGQTFDGLYRRVAPHDGTLNLFI
jgi:flagellar hook-length control protein FliK